ncbi:MAG: CTP synthase [Patescibacteria group bacterium]
MKKHPKFIFVTGGTVSGLGKGVTVASISALLKSRGISVLPLKIDPYLNKDAGTMNPYQHGEVFVTDDGAETDLDLGHYERFTGLNLSRDSNFTTGAVYEEVIHQERQGNFLGKTIQIIPHITDEIKKRVIGAAKRHKADVCIAEIGGTVGDIEAEPFLETIRQILREEGSDNVIFVHVVKMDYIYPSDEAKTKPIQQSVAVFRERGIQPDFLVVRCKRPLTRENFEKISLFTNVPEERVIPALDVEILYEVPLNFKKSRFDDYLLERLGIRGRKRDMRKWQRAIGKIKRAGKKVKIALVGKYVGNSDAYISVEEAIKTAAGHAGAKAEIIHVESETDDVLKKIKTADGIVIPGGFGKRGIEGKIKAVRFARENNIPLLGLCLGLQVAVIEFARNVCGMRNANSTEFDPKTPHPVIDILPSQKGIKEMGGTMRLGSATAVLGKNSRVASLYKGNRIAERHRHRYEVNPEYHGKLSKGGLVLSGINTQDKRLVEFIELPKHRFFVATQAHPEFKSRFIEPHPLFLGLVKAVLGRK